MPEQRILLLGGTRMAREAANALVARGQPVVTSLAGVTLTPHLPQGEIHVGGFGGVAGLMNYLAHEAFDWVVDAAHPFAAQMSAHAHEACKSVGLRLLRLEAPAWQPQKGDAWHRVDSMVQAVEALPRNAKVVITVGRKEIAAFFARADVSGVARMIEAPNCAVPAHWQALFERPPFTLEAEIDLLRACGASLLVSKNAGGARAAKLDAAAALGLGVVMVARPFKPAIKTVINVSEMLGTLGFAD